MPVEELFIHEGEEEDDRHPMRYLPIGRLYSSTAPCVSPSGSSMSKKVKARKLHGGESATAVATAVTATAKDEHKPTPTGKDENKPTPTGKDENKPTPDLKRKRNADNSVQVYSRRIKKAHTLSFFDSLPKPPEPELDAVDPGEQVGKAGGVAVEIGAGGVKPRKKKSRLKNELMWLGGGGAGETSGRRLRGSATEPEEQTPGVVVGDDLIPKEQTPGVVTDVIPEEQTAGVVTNGILEEQAEEQTLGIVTNGLPEEQTPGVVTVTDVIPEEGVVTDIIPEQQIPADVIEIRTGDGRSASKKNKLRHELLWLGVEGGGDSSAGETSGRRLRGGEARAKIDFCETKKRGVHATKDVGSSGKEKKWVEVEVEGADPLAFVGLECKVYWPLDKDWYKGSITGYNPETERHDVEYEDGDIEHLILLNEKAKVYISSNKMESLNLKCIGFARDDEEPNYNEIISLAVSFDDCHDLEPGALVWAKLTGHAMWPAVIVNEPAVYSVKSLTPVGREQSLLVQFFGTHDFARINVKQAIPFLNGLSTSLHLKCKKTRFHRSLDEAKMYLSKQQLPKSMLQLQKGIGIGGCKDDFGEDEEVIKSRESLGKETAPDAAECIISSPINLGDLCVTNLGKIVSDSEHFHDKHHIWPEGYMAFRKFASITDPSSTTSYNMEVLRNPKLKSRPLFRVTLEDGEQVDGSNPTACWKEIYSRIRKNQCNGFRAEVEGSDLQKSGSYMFGFSNLKINKLIQDLSNSTKNKDSWEVPAGYKAVRISWKDLDRCSVCHMDEEYEDNLFLQCDKCRMMVHARCYGELEPLGGVLWLCNLCRPGAPRTTPPCSLCPVVGGAIKPTTDGRWAHLTCAMWIPETCLLDVKRMEPIDGLGRISKDRWKLLCSICNVAYGACIQCSNSTCRVAYHPLCARAADLCFELEDEDTFHVMSPDDDDDQCIRLLSFCKKHRQPSNERQTAADNLTLPIQHGDSYFHKSNPSGCARTEPYNFFGRRGQREPEAHASASVKRLYVENRCYLVSGYCQNGVGSGSFNESLHASGAKRTGADKDNFGNIFSMSEKYNNMKATFRKRLAFGKSRIHGFGVFTKLAHKAGDMVIEYTGELVRPPIADIREHRIYNSLVGAGTYMFRIDDERVVDATKAGSIAQLINHSCEPNCYSRMITVNGDEHIIIFAKRDIQQWEELTYDYRFFSVDVQLPCYCGFQRCRGVVNDLEAEEQQAKIWAPRGDLIHWRGD